MAADEETPADEGEEDEDDDDEAAFTGSVDAAPLTEFQTAVAHKRDEREWK